MKKLFVSVGESSGDLQAGAVVRQLRNLVPDLHVYGIGGDNLAQAGQDNVFGLERLSVMGGVEVLAKLPGIFNLLGEIKELFAQDRPDAVLLVDSAAFNFRVGKLARKMGIPVIYFIPPKIWAWNTGRVKFLKKNADLVISILPFEREFYAKHQVPFYYSGNPLVDLLDPVSQLGLTPHPGRIGLMPGSRRKEVEPLLPVFGQMAEMLSRERPGLQFHCIRAPGMDEEYLRQLWNSKTPLHFVENDRRYAFIPTCQAIVAASGTATLETGLLKTPTLVTYKLNSLTWFLASRLVKVNWVSLTNLILQRELFPELLQDQCKPENLAKQLGSWLDNPQQLEAMRADLQELSDLCGEPGGSRRAAEKIAAFL